MASAAPLIIRYGVTEWYPSGIGFTFAINVLLYSVVACSYVIECGALRRRATCRLPAGTRQRNPGRPPRPKTARRRRSRLARSVVALQGAHSRTPDLLDCATRVYRQNKPAARRLYA